MVGQPLQPDVRRGEQRARRRTEEHAGAVAQHLPLLRRQEQEGTDPDHPGLERDHPGKLVARMGPVNVARRQREEREARGREADAEPLALAELEAEQALGQEAEEDEPGRERRLDDRERRDPEGADVQEPPHGRASEVRRLSGHDRVFLVGHSLGGLIAYAAAPAIAAEVAGIVTLGSPYHFTRGSRFLTAFGADLRSRQTNLLSALSRLERAPLSCRRSGGRADLASLFGFGMAHPGARQPRAAVDRGRENRSVRYVRSGSVE